MRENRRIAYMTNVYTRPSHRGTGVGGRLVQQAQQSARRADVELVIVWPSEESVGYYKSHGFKEPSADDEPLIWESGELLAE